MISAIKRTFDTARTHAMAIGGAVREDYHNTVEEHGRLRAGYNAAQLGVTGIGTGIYLVGHESLMGTAATNAYVAAETMRPGSGIIGAALGGAVVSAIAEFGLSEAIPPVLAKSPRTAEVIEEQKYGATDQTAVAIAANKTAVSLLAGSPGNIIGSYGRNPKAPPEVHRRVGRRVAVPLTALNAVLWGGYGLALNKMPGSMMTTVVEYAHKPYAWLGLIGGLYALGKTANFTHKTIQSLGEERERRRPDASYDPWSATSNTIGEPLLPPEEAAAPMTPLAQAFAASDERKVAQAAQREADALAAIAKKHADDIALQDEQWLKPARLARYLEVNREHMPLHPNALSFLGRVYGNSDALPTLRQPDINNLANDLLDLYYYNLNIEADRTEAPKVSAAERTEFRRALQQHLEGADSEDIARQSAYWTAGLDVECAILHMTASLRSWDNRLFSNEGQKEEYQYPSNKRLCAPSEALQQYYRGGLATS